MGRPPSPAPADFAVHATSEGLNALRVRYGQCTSTIKRWVEETGVVRPVLNGGKIKRPVPDDFAEMTSKHSNLELMAHYACGSEMLYRWRKESGTKRRDKMIIPGDFAEVWKTKGILQLAAHYGRNHSTVTLWIKRLGLVRPRGRTLAQQARVTQPKPAPTPKVAKVPVSPKCAPSRFIKPDAFRTAPLDRVQRDMSAAGVAADTLRRDRWTVFRCDTKGKPSPNGKMWICGRVLCTADELIERAERAARRMAA